MADVWDVAEEARRYRETPYDRATYMRLQRLMAPIQAATNDSHNVFADRGMMSPSPPPTTQGYRDKANYLFDNKAIFERETAAMKACVHSSAPANCVARATMHGSQVPTISMTPSERLAAIGRSSGKGAAASFLAQQLTQQPKGAYNKTQLDAMQRSIQSHHSATSAPSSPKKGPSKHSRRGGKLRKSRKGRKGRKSRKSRK